MPAASEFPALRVDKPVRRLIVVLGDQLDHASAAFDDFDDSRDAVLMVEVAGESESPPSHRQRTILFLSAMRHFALECRERARRVQYSVLDDPENEQDLDAEVRRQIDRLAPEMVRCTHPGSWPMFRTMEGWSETLSAKIEIVPDNHFLVSPEQFIEWAEGRRSLVMEHFYRWQRRRLGVLVDEKGQPAGDRWNFDADNRESFRRAPRIRRPYRARPDAITQEVIDLVESRLPDLPGRVDHFRWPVTRAEARRALSDFIEHRLARFGPYEDAMWTDETTIYHSRLSAALNLKLLRPMECVEAALVALHERRAPLQSVEAFIRQIIGWREFIRGVYWREGEEYADRNALEHHAELPEMYWTGQTDMACMRECLSQVLDEAYGHHIQRLMITGNFALLLGVRPRAVSDWYLGMYADGVDWVTVPNTIGMALHADGGVVGTKPYAASGNYISRMSNYCEGCRYDVNKRTGADACPFNTLYWDFLIRHRERFRSNHRMAMMLKNVDRLPREQKVEITVSARRVRESLAVDSDAGTTESSRR